MQPRHPSSLRAAARGRLRLWVPLLWAGIFLLAQGMGTYHVASVIHRHCEDHGQVEETDDGHLHELAVRGGSGAKTSGFVASPADKPGEEPHSACHLEASLRERALVPCFAVPPAGRTVDLDVAAPRGSAQRCDQVALLRLAPKQSPPA